MVKIIFHNRDDAVNCYHHLRNELRLTPCDEKFILMKEHHTVAIATDKITDPCFHQIKEVFCQFILKVKREDWLRHILKSRYYYHDLDEQCHIIDIIHSILDGERRDLAVFLKKPNEEKRILEEIDHFFQNCETLSFDSFVKFRLRSYFLELDEYVKVSIDEYKMEQEYQMFVQTLREFLLDREPKIEVLHLLLDEGITFYNESLEEMKRSELTEMVDRKLLFNHPVYVDSFSIAPLLSIAPTTIFLYTKDPEAALVRTIKNIFEERVSIMPIHIIGETKAWARWNGGIQENRQ